jgi:hypothetical protein
MAVSLKRDLREEDILMCGVKVAAKITSTKRFYPILVEQKSFSHSHRWQIPFPATILLFKAAAVRHGSFLHYLCEMKS